MSRFFTYRWKCRRCLLIVPDGQVMMISKLFPGTRGQIVL